MAISTQFLLKISIERHAYRSWEYSNWSARVKTAFSCPEAAILLVNTSLRRERGSYSSSATVFQNFSRLFHGSCSFLTPNAQAICCSAKKIYILREFPTPDLVYFVTFFLRFTELSLEFTDFPSFPGPAKKSLICQNKIPGLWIISRTCTHSWSSRKETPSGSRKSVRNWSWPLTVMCKYRVCMS